MIRFRAIGVQDFIGLVAPAFTAALFIERVIEVFVSIARGADARRLRAASEPAERRVNQADAPESKREATVAREKLAAFQSETQYVTLVGGTALGLVLSVLGIRVLEQLVQADVLARAHGWQESGFRMFDVVRDGWAYR